MYRSVPVHGSPTYDNARSERSVVLAMVIAPRFTVAPPTESVSALQT